MNFEDYAEKPDENTLEALKRKADEANEVQQIIDELESQLSEAKARYRELTEREMVSVMMDLGIQKFSLDSGEALDLTEFYAGSLNKSPDPEAGMNWIQSNGGVDLIKTDVNLSFGKSEHNMAIDLVETLRERGYDPAVKEGVHPSTLAAFAREKMREYYDALEKGETMTEPPLETIGIYHGHKVKIKKGKT